MNGNVQEVSRIAAAEECERAVAGACLMFPREAVQALNELTFAPEQMLMPIPRRVVEFARAKVSAGEVPSYPEFAVHIADAFPALDGSYLTSLCDHIGDGTRIPAWVDGIQGVFRRRQAGKRFREIIEDLEAGNHVDAVCETAGSWLREFGRPIRRKETQFSNLLSDRLGEYTQPIDPAKTIKTGFSDLDDFLSLEGSDFFIIGGGTGSGKSMFGLNLVANILQNPDCKGAGLIVSLEMPAHQIVDRMVARFSQVSTATLKRRTFNHSELPRIAKAATQAARMNLHIRDDCHELHQITAAARALHADSGLRVLMVDYLQLVRGPDRELREQQVAAVSRELRLLGIETGALIIGLIQLNKQGEARESSAIQMDATQFASLRLVNTEGKAFRAEEEEELDETRRRLEVGKQRDGGVGSVLLGFDGARAAFFDTEQPEKSWTKKQFKRKPKA